MSLKDQMDGIYQGLPLGEIPWNQETPPDLLVDLVESRRVAPCDAVDLGCGAGTYAVWLAGRGFRMTGIDVSPAALDLAGRLAAEKGVVCRFIAADLTGEVVDLDRSFDFAYDWEVLHHVFPEERGRYVANVHRMLRPGGRYLSVCFSEEDAFRFEGEGKYRTTSIGTRLYFSSEQELRDLFDPLFRIQELRAVEVAGRRGPHSALMALMTRREPHPSLA